MCTRNTEKDPQRPVRPEQNPKAQKWLCGQSAEIFNENHTETGKGRASASAIANACQLRADSFRVLNSFVGKARRQGGAIC